jgi:AraC-like DNA-binding protein
MSSLEAARAATLMQEYIETKLREPITLRELADVAGYSPWHAARLFKEATGLSPFCYIRSRRLTKAALLLRDGEERVIDVALDFVFDSTRGSRGPSQRSSGSHRSVTAKRRRRSGCSCRAERWTLTGITIRRRKL